MGKAVGTINKAWEIPPAARSGCSKPRSCFREPQNNFPALWGSRDGLWESLPEAWDGSPNVWECLPKAWASLLTVRECFPNLWASFPNLWDSFLKPWDSLPKGWACFPKARARQKPRLPARDKDHTSYCLAIHFRPAFSEAMLLEKSVWQSEDKKLLIDSKFMANKKDLKEK